MNKVLLTVFGAAVAMKTQTESLESKLSYAETTQETFTPVFNRVLAQVTDELDLTATDEELASHCVGDIHCHHNEYLDVRDCECKCLPQECPEDFIWDQGDCSCQCLNPAEGCPENQSWNFEMCSCDCDVALSCEEFVPNEALGLPEGLEFYWDTEKCSCQCVPQLAACAGPLDPVPEMWNEEECRCQCVPQDCAPDASGKAKIWDSGDCACRYEQINCGEGFTFDNSTGECYCDVRQCVASQYFDQKSCSCQCTPLVCPSGQYFNTHACDCLCEPQSCEEGEIFSVEECSCVCEREQCAADQYWDNSSCSCQCIPELCLDMQIWDPDTCTCICCPIMCTNDTHWDQESCQCIFTPHDCGLNFYFDQESGSCKCIPTTCEEGKFFNTQKCECVCDVEDCSLVVRLPDGSYGLSQGGAGEKMTTWDGNYCACKCIAEDCAANSYWNMDTCSCLTLETCPTDGEYFNIELQKCMRLPGFCPDGFHWDSSNDSCQCEPEVCDDPTTYWDENSCRCECIPKECDTITVNGVVFNAYYDAASCECKCSPPDNLVITPESEFLWDYKLCKVFPRPQECECGKVWDMQANECIFTEKPCPVGEYFNVEDGECHCLEQLCKSTMHWDNENCQCVCSPLPCPDITVEVDGTPVTNKYFWDASTCSCQLQKRDCEEGFHFNFNTGLCDCSPIDCDINGNIPGKEETWNRETCQCECKYQEPPSSDQIFNSDPAVCDFECRPRDCVHSHLYWDTIECDCLCKDETCPNDFEWVPRKCACVCQLTEDDCDASQFFDEATCACRLCIVVPCLPNEFWNTNLCSCQCIPECCEEGTSWNFSSCACESDEVPCTLQCPPGQIPNANCSGCNCPITAAQCPIPDSTLDSNCQCIPPVTTCSCPPGMQAFGSFPECNCQCPFECPGAQVHGLDCQCGCETVCQDGQQQDPFTCQCIAQNPGCTVPDISCIGAPSLWIQNPDCTCSCPPIQCENGAALDPNTCLCDPCTGDLLDPSLDPSTCENGTKSGVKMVGCNWSMVDITDDFFPMSYNFETGQNDKVKGGHLCEDDSNNVWPLIKYNWPCSDINDPDCTSKFTFYPAGFDDHFFIQSDRRSKLAPAGCPEYSWLSWSNEECIKAPLEVAPEDSLAEILQVSHEERGLWKAEQRLSTNQYNELCVYYVIMPAEDPTSNAAPGYCVENEYVLDFKDKAQPTNIGLSNVGNQNKFVLLGLYSGDEPGSLPYCDSLV